MGESHNPGRAPFRPFGPDVGGVVSRGADGHESDELGHWNRGDPVRFGSPRHPPCRLGRQRKRASTGNGMSRICDWHRRDAPYSARTIPAPHTKGYKRSEYQR